MVDSLGITSRQTPLHSLHEALGASFTDFAGWQMPVRYTSDLAEHHAVRATAGLFDVSHMAEFEVSGPQVGAFLDFAVSSWLSPLELGQAKYALLLNEDGGVIDDLIVYRTGPFQYFVVANAGNRESAWTALKQRSVDFDVELHDVSDQTALLALQGPKAYETMMRVFGLEVGQTPLADLKYYRAIPARFEGEPVLIGRTGYTGEDGFELFIDASHAVPLWQALMNAGGPIGLVPAGLACRDTLRLEAGMPLYGHELNTTTLPVQAGLGRAVSLVKGNFVGRDAVVEGPGFGAPVLVGLIGDGRRAPRADYRIFSGDVPVGVVTSGALSPTLGYPIAMAFVDPDYAESGSGLEVDVRGTRLPVVVADLPFYQRKKN
jgi:aminomethyltransferase